MNIENRAIKLYLKSLPPLEAKALIKLFDIPSPYKEILITVCVERKSGYQAIRSLSDEYGIYLEYWTFCRRLKTALEMFRKSNARIM